MIDRRNVTAGLGASMAAAALGGPAHASLDDPLLFAHFTTGRGEATGLRFAMSADGFTFHILGGGASYLVPQVGERKLMRDPFLFRGTGRDRQWYLLWTTAWEGVTIGHATSPDLVHWSAQTAVPVMASVPGTRNTWAPEAIWDAGARHWQVFWSSTVAGRFAATEGTSEQGYNHRLWRATTRDFVRFTPAEPLYDPGFSVIDGTFARTPDGALYLVVKDETLVPPRKHIRAARAQTPAGPFGPLSPPFTPSWVEGPMLAQVGADTICYYDVYRGGRWGACRTRDFVTWQDVSARLAMPAGARHGSLVRISQRELAQVEAGPAPR